MPLVFEEATLDGHRGHDHEADRHGRPVHRAEQPGQPRGTAGRTRSRRRATSRQLEGAGAEHETEDRVRERPEEPQQLARPHRARRYARRASAAATPPRGPTGGGILTSPWPIGRAQEDGALLEVPPSPPSWASGSAWPATSSTSWAGSCATILGRPRPRRRRPGLRDGRAAARDHEGPARVGRPSVPGRCGFGTVGARKGDTLLEVTTFREEVYAEEHRKPAVTFAPGPADRPVPARLHRERDGRPASRGRVRRSVRRREGSGGAGRLDTPLEPRDRLLRRPASHAPGHAVRRPARGRPSRPASWRRSGACASGCEIVSAERIRDELDKLLVAPTPSVGLELGRDGPRRRLPARSSRRCASSRTPSTGTRTCCATRSPWSNGANPTSGCASPRCCTTSASRGRAQITSEGVTFHHHEVVGARMARERLQALRYPRPIVDDVVRLVEMHLRFHGYPRVDRQRRAALRPRRGPAARSPEPAHAGRLHDAEPVQGEDGNSRRCRTISRTGSPARRGGTSTRCDRRSTGCR